MQQGKQNCGQIRVAFVSVESSNKRLHGTEQKLPRR